MPTVWCPGMSTDQFPKGRYGMTTDELITCLERSYSVWILSFAKALLNDPDGGFAVLLLLNPYPEMIGKILHPVRNPEENYRRGLYDMFKELPDNPHSRQVTKHIYEFMRNGLAHTSFTDMGIELSGEIDVALEVQVRNDPPELDPSLRVYIRINPAEWYSAVQGHFWNFILRLRDTNQVELRAQFREWMLDPMAKRNKASKKPG